MPNQPAGEEPELPAGEDRDRRLGPYPINWAWIQAETHGSMFDGEPPFDTFVDQELEAIKQQMADDLLDLFTELATRLKEADE